MKKIIQTSLYIVTIVLSLNTAAAEEKTGDGHITAKASTMGFGIEYNYPVTSVLSIGIGVNKFSANKTLTKHNVHYNADVDFKSASIITNYHPFSNGFRLRAGTYYNDNKINLSADSSTGAITIASTEFTNADIAINGELSFKKFSPYIGIGYGSEPIGDNTLSLDIDIGVMQSPIKVQLTGTCEANPTKELACDLFDPSLAKAKADLEEEAGKIKLYPIVSLGLSYRF
ncbi:hypothetical protein [Bathymodiolus thermophilus thioautotrophic gill symbiont]|uniref:Outer membrane protein beta-barrel domain-containing protein n=1 Tax=Bathymodiolus thermophilus thioautotrophic gill symbiont TaxID=2360 RepID=A0A8H9CES3_9GAMM|nr:hypothetical protein [Bathymodiolus thermophilus thioautotrophic gill symbiont]CAB5495063.1 hypothetical protein THERMOS_221 [Bathymodiolus thermophilus thioautotrophic gill symbiont]